MERHGMALIYLMIDTFPGICYGIGMDDLTKVAVFCKEIKLFSQLRRLATLTSTLRYRKLSGLDAKLKKHGDSAVEAISPNATHQIPFLDLATLVHGVS